MHAIVSGLGSKHSALVAGIWQKLESRCGLRGIFHTPIPHFSYQVSQTYDFEGLAGVLAGIAAATEPFQVRTAGLGVFTGKEDIVLYLALVPDKALLAFQERVWQTSLPFSTGALVYYAPGHWVPHITLAHADVDRDGLACAARLLAGKQLSWEIQVDHLAWIYQEVGQTGRQGKHFSFGHSFSSTV